MDRKPPQEVGFAPRVGQADRLSGVGPPRGFVTQLSRTFSSFQSRPFRLYWFAMVSHMGSMNIQLVARAWLVYYLSGSAALLGGVFMANAAPAILLALFGGVLADRIPKKYILVVGQTASGVIALGIALGLSLGWMSRPRDVIYLFIASFIQGVVMALSLPSRQAIIPELVEREKLMNAIALNTVGHNLNRLLAPAVAGLLIALVGISGAYYFMAFLYALAVLLILPIPLSGTLSLAAGAGTWSHLKDGLAYMRRDRVVLALLVLNMLMVGLSIPYLFLLPIFAKDIFVLESQDLLWMVQIPWIGGWLRALPGLLAKDSFRLGVLVSVSGFGAIAASLVIASRGNKNRGKLFLLNGVFLGLALAFFSMTSWYFLAVLLMVPVGLGHAARLAFSNTLIQVHSEERYRGRVMSLYLMEWGLSSFGVFVISLLAEAVGVQWAVGGAGALLAMASVYALAFVPTIRRL